MKLKKIIKTIENFKNCRVLHIGDLILDQFLFGEVLRISREAPVLILKYKETINIPGGGANCLNNLLSLGAKVIPIGIVGEDSEGEWILNYFKDKGVNIKNIFKVKNYHTPVKTRVLAGSFHSSMKQMLRIDKEGEEEFNPSSLKEKIFSCVKNNIKNVDGVVISDYGYGIGNPKFLKEIITYIVKKGKKIVVDSRFKIKEFRNVTSITPNISEIEEAYGIRIGNNMAKMDKIAQKIIDKQNLEAILITRGRLGMSLYERGEKPFHIPVFGSDEVADVTGAGDTVIAVYSLSLFSKADFKTSATLSNYAGGIVVMKRGTATLSSRELISAIINDSKKEINENEEEDS